MRCASVVEITALTDFFSTLRGKYDMLEICLDEDVVAGNWLVTYSNPFARATSVDPRLRSKMASHWL